MDHLIREEQPYLKRTIEIIEKQLEEKRAAVKKPAADVVEEEILRQNVRDLRRLEAARPKPYFGRLDFEDEFGMDTIYVGKHGIQHDGDVVVVDWRADLGKLYNAYQGVKADFYLDNDPTRKVTIKGKRAITIENDRVVHVAQVGKTEIVETPSSGKIKMMDPYLEEILRRTGHELQLREIIASIQAEQDEIIRLPLRHTVLVQGAAGSGKSTIALHRISYLLYQHQGKIKPNQVLVLAPNEMFLSYIRNVVPELDIDGIEQWTFYDWASEHFTDVRNIPDLHDLYVELQNDEQKEKRILVSKFKGSLRFKQLLDDLVAEVGRSLLPYKDIELKDGGTLSKREIDEFYASREHLPLNVRLREVKQFILNWSKKQITAFQEKLEAEFDSAYHRWVLTLPEGPERKSVYEALERAKDLRLKLFREQAEKEIDGYVRKMEEITAVRMYKSVFQKRVFDHFYKDIDEKLLALLLQNGRKIKEDRFSYEDIAPLIYLDAKMNGKRLEYEHIVIDEAQDYSPFQLAILKDYAKSMTVLGDVAQGIFSFYGLDSWDEFQVYMQDHHEVKRIDIQTSYRSTREIMDLANRVLINNSYPYPLVIPVNRSGRQPRIERVESFWELCGRVEETLKEFIRAGHQTIAVITKDAESAADLYEELTRRGITEVELVVKAHHRLRKRAVVIPAYLVKGLEFDAVMIDDVSDKVYPDTAHHAKMLYMSISRAHHELVLFHRGNLSPLLEERDPSEPPRPRPSFSDWLITDWRNPDIQPQVMKERVVEDTETIPLFEGEEQRMTVERFEDDRERVNDFHAWLIVRENWVKRKIQETAR